MNHNDERDYAEEAANRAEMRSEETNDGATRIDTSGDYPVIVSVPDGAYFARPADPDESYPFAWVVIHQSTGEHRGAGDEDTARAAVAGLNRTDAGPVRPLDVPVDGGKVVWLGGPDDVVTLLLPLDLRLTVAGDGRYSLESRGAQRWHEAAADLYRVVASAEPLPTTTGS